MSYRHFVHCIIDGLVLPWGGEGGGGYLTFERELGDFDLNIL